MPELGEHVPTLPMNGVRDSLPARNLLVGIQAGAPNHPPPAIEIDVASETMSPPSEARCE